MARILAIDYGSKRVGLAVTDPLQIIASGLTTVHSKDLIAFSLAFSDNFPTNFPFEKSFVSSKINNTDGIKNEPFGISFNSTNETEPGLIDFEELENSINYWKNNYNRS